LQTLETDVAEISQVAVTSNGFCVSTNTGTLIAFSEWSAVPLYVLDVSTTVGTAFHMVADPDTRDLILMNTESALFLVTPKDQKV